MAGFLPVNNILGQTDELKNVSYNVTYTDALGVSYPVTITPVNTNSTIIINGNRINGYFSDSFYNEIYYRNKDDTFTTVHKFSEINKNNISELIHYFADATTDISYSFIASANGQTKEYEVVVTNNWTTGRNELVKLINQTAVNDLYIHWKNNSGTIIPWINTSGTNINWTNN